MSLIGCGDWPRHANLPSENSNAIPTEGNPAEAIEIDWTELGEEYEPNDAPGEPVSLAIGDGVSMNGTLSGIGWDPSAPKTPPSDCGESVAFPPSLSGNYLGDVDWLAIVTDEAATLCATVHLEDDDVSFDLTMYVLDECGEPVEIFIDDERPIGVERTGGRWSGSVVVPKNSRVGLALGSYWPDDLQAEIPWDLSVSLVPPLTDILLCPDIR